MRKRKKRLADPDMLPEYEFKNMVRGKYAGRVTPKSRVFLVPDEPMAADGPLVRKDLVRAMRSKVREIRAKMDELEALIRAEETSAVRR